jgi:ABC-2 type transport system ATP-binding protein
MSLIEIRNVSKNYGETRALKNISLTLAPDKIYGLLGRNGAGKTTLVNIINNKIFATSGQVLVDGESAEENDHAQSKIFCMTENNIHPKHMRIKEGFRWTSEFYPMFDMEYAGALADKFELDTNKYIKKLSTGYGSIFKLVLTLASGATVLIFDEPVLGLDANHREMFYRELIAYYSEHPKTVVISTHLIDEVAEVLEEVVILKNGEIMLAQPIESVLQLAYTVSGASTDVEKYALGKNVIREESFGNLKSATLFQNRTRADRDAVRDLGLEITSARLQEIFVSLTNA